MMNSVLYIKNMVCDRCKMAEMMNVPILGIVENMSYFECPDNGRKYEIFGKSHVACSHS